MEEQLITFDTAKLAKEKGFDITFDNWGEYSFYKPDRLKAKGNKEFYLLKYEEYEGELYPLVTQSLLQKWLREKHNIHLVIQYSKHWEGYQWRYDDWRFREENPNMRRSYYTDFKTYEEALEIGLQEALKLI